MVLCPVLDEDFGSIREEVLDDGDFRLDFDRDIGDLSLGSFTSFCSSTSGMELSVSFLKAWAIPGLFIGPSSREDVMSEFTCRTSDSSTTVPDLSFEYIDPSFAAPGVDGVFLMLCVFFFFLTCFVSDCFEISTARFALVCAIPFLSIRAALLPLSDRV